MGGASVGFPYYAGFVLGPLISGNPQRGSLFKGYVPGGHTHVVGIVGIVDLFLMCIFVSEIEETAHAHIHMRYVHVYIRENVNI